mgnify:CR=1 FL=1
MIGNLKCKPKEAENVVQVGTLVTVKEPWLTYSVRGNDGRWLNIWRPALDDHSPRPGEPAIITEIIEGGRYGDQFHIVSLDGRREDWFKSGDFEVLEPEAAAEAIAQFKEKDELFKQVNTASDEAYVCLDCEAVLFRGLPQFVINKNIDTELKARERGMIHKGSGKGSKRKGKKKKGKYVPWYQR